MVINSYTAADGWLEWQFCVAEVDATVTKLAAFRFGTDADNPTVIGTDTSVTSLQILVSDLAGLHALVHNVDATTAPTLHLVCNRALSIREDAIQLLAELDAGSR